MRLVCLLILIAYLCGVSSYTGFSQGATVYSINNTPFIVQANRIPETGNPFWYPEFLPAKVFLQNGRTIDTVKVKLNLATNELSYSFGGDQEFISITPVTRVVFYGGYYRSLPTVFLTGLNAGRKVKPDYFLELLLESNDYFLLKKILVTSVVNQDMGKRVKSFQRDSAYFVKDTKGAINEIRRPEDMVLLFPDRAEIIRSYIKKEFLRKDFEAALIKLFSFSTDIQKE